MHDISISHQDYGNDEVVYQNSPADYIWNQHDGWFIDKYRQADIIVCTGLGDWEQDGLNSFHNLKRAFEEKNIPAWFDTWGTDVAHDWGMVEKTDAIFPSFDWIIS